MKSSGKLYLVPTPVGNLEDMTFRAVRILNQVDTILCEDTRTSSTLLQHFNIHKPLRSHHLHNEHTATNNIVKELIDGKIIALITDAGTPGISDPGFLLARACIQAGIPVECLPGATAFVPALVISGLPCNEFTFAGFLPPKKGRQTKLQELATQPRTVILYESPHKILSTLEHIVDIFGSETSISLSREISKKFEETIRGTALQVLEIIKVKPPKGEIVLCIQPPFQEKKKKEKTADYYK